MHPALRQVHPLQAAHVVHVVEPLPPHRGDVALLHHQLLHHRRSGHWLKREGWKRIEAGAMQPLLNTMSFATLYLIRTTEYDVSFFGTVSASPGGQSSKSRSSWIFEGSLSHQLELEDDTGEKESLSCALQDLNVGICK